jgi:hypothetical protein
VHLSPQEGLACWGIRKPHMRLGGSYDRKVPPVKVYWEAAKEAARRAQTVGSQLGVAPIAGDYSFVGVEPP